MDCHNKITPLSLGIISALYGGYVAADQVPNTPQNSDHEVITVTGTALTVDRLDLEQSAKDNPTLSEALKHEPRVGINDAQNAMQGGDLKPEEISLSGARPHQTKYTINGVGVNNTTTFADGNSNTANDLSSGHTAGYFVDTNLIDSVDVLDHNIGAEYGGFTGGVIDAHIRKPTDEFVIDYNYRMNDSDWNASQKVGDNFQDGYGTPIDGSGEYQPNYQKRMHSLHMGGAISDTQKLAINVSKQVSEIPLANDKDVDQSMDNLFITHIWESGSWLTTTDLRYAGHTSHNFLNDTNSPDGAFQQGSETVNSHTGLGGTFKVDYTMANGHWSNSFSYDHLIDEREADTDYFAVFMTIDANGIHSYNQGSYGNLKQTQDSYQYKSAFYFDPIFTGAIEIQPSFGVELSHQQASVDRPDEHVAYQYLDMFGNASISSLTRYNAANYSADAQQYGLFADSKMQWDRLGVYMGGRIDHMSVFDSTVFSPRFTASWDFDLASTNRVTLGANRYYSGNLLGWALKAEQGKYTSTSRTCTAIDGDWSNLDQSNLDCASTTDPSSLVLSDADVPYADELSASWAIDINNFALNTTYIYRMQRDGITYTDDDATLHNNIQSENQIVSFDVATKRPYQLAGGYFSANWKIAYNYRRGHGDLGITYDQGNDLGSGYQDEWVMLDGELVRYSEMDVSGYQSPLKSTLDLNMFWANAGVVLNNRVNYQQGKKATSYTGVTSVDIEGNNETVKTLESTKLDELITWDMAVNWTPPQLDDHLILGLSVTNVLNTQKVTSISGAQAGISVPNEHYNSGRQVWLNVNLRN
ncbi:TonB-dependent receptor plug domain-containing protein [Vibrio rarus]|uniref:TonB-dependent receptor plug domain-containing protein n=1 Tax=Vibrio rarus TaxID=413403 RepID=UPI0021C3F209|nr:TonB-dependent receptor plug domain-containing protein [Vibrio rarus]